MEVKDYIKLPYTRLVQEMNDESGHYFYGRILELDGCQSTGDTLEELYDVGRHFKWSGDCTVAANKNLPIKAVTHTACGKKRHAFFLHRTGKAV